MTRPALVTWLFGWKQLLTLAANVLVGRRSTCVSLQGSFEVECSGVGVLSLGLSSANGRSLVVMCVSLGSFSEATAPTGGEELLAGGVISLWLLGLRCSRVLW